jgi:hypothetical protein
VSGIDLSWYPSCVVKLVIRFDEALQIQKPRDEISFDALTAQTQEARILGTSTTQGDSAPRVSDTGKHRPRRALDNRALAAADLTLPSNALTPGAGATSQRTSSNIPRTEIEPLTFGTDGFTVIANRVPKKGTFTLPHPRSAPTFSLTFDYVEFPIDPQLMRAVGVEIHLGAVSAEDFARGMRGAVDEDGRPLSILKTTTDMIDPFTGRKDVNEGTLLFYATADTWDVDHGENGATITIEGREIRAILLDTKYVAAQVAKVKLDQPINDVIADLLQTIPFEHGFRLTVATNETEWPNGIVPSPGTVDGMTAVRAKAASSPTAKTKEASGGAAGVATGDKATQSTPENGGKATYWDLITNYCELVGAMPHIIGSMLWIRPIHRIFDIVDPGSKIPAPFANGKSRQVGSEQVRVRRLVLGREIKRIKVQRKFGGVTIVPTVQTISFDDRAQGKQRLIFGQWPPAGSGAAEAKAESELLRVPMWGIRSVDQLTQIARGIYEEMGRGETGGTAETGNLASFGGSNDDPDLLRLRPLEPIEFVTDASALQASLPIAADVNNLARLTFAQEVDQLHTILGDLALARALVGLSRGAIREVIRYYQVVGVTFDWDKGVKTSLQFQNYVIPRHFEPAVSDVASPSPSGVRTRPVKVAGGGKKANVDPKGPKRTPVPTGTGTTANNAATVLPHLNLFDGTLGPAPVTPDTRPTRPRNK